jgi:hypothetical protein
MWLKNLTKKHIGTINFLNITIMKATTAKKRLESSTFTKNSKAYRFAFDIINGAKTIRPCYTSGSGRFTSNQDHTKALCCILDQINIKYKLTNDASRGSATGNLITILTKFS